MTCIRFLIRSFIFFWSSFCLLFVAKRVGIMDFVGLYQVLLRHRDLFIHRTYISELQIVSRERISIRMNGCVDI